MLPYVPMVLPVFAGAHGRKVPLLLPPQTFFIGDGRPGMWTGSRQEPRRIPNLPPGFRQDMAAGEAANRVMAPKNRAGTAARTDHCHHPIPD